MQDTHKYLVHARITADGVVERSDVVGAVFGQTEGLLGDELDLRDLQESSRIGRIDVEIDSEHGQSFGYITIASSLDKAETAILGAALEAITRVGPCEARVEVAEIEDMRAAKRREIVDRAKELLRESFDESVMDSTEILEEVREVRRVEGIVEYEGLPAGPRVADSDAVILVEGRSDVVTLLGYGIKNAVAVEGTNVPDEIADLTRDRTVTAFLDGDRGGDLILRELAQVGEIDYVAAAPDGRSVEDLSRGDVMDALREKVPFGSIEQFERDPSTALTATDEAESDGGTAVDPGSSADPTVEPGTSTEEPTPGDSTDRVTPESGTGGASSESDVSSGDDLSGASDLSSAGDTSETADASRGSRTDAETTETSGATPGAESPSVETASGTTVTDETETASGVESASGAETAATDEAETTAGPEAASESGADEPAVAGDTETAESDATEGESAAATLQGHVRAVIDAESKRARLLDREMTVLRDVPAAEAFDAVSDTEGDPFAVVLDDRLEQRLLDVAAQRGIEQIVARSEGEYVKRPASVRVVTADRLVSS